MAWNNTENIVKFEGKCWNRGKHKYCSYWMAKKSLKDGKAIGYRCTLFDEDKEGYASLSQCDREYGQTYDGKK